MSVNVAALRAKLQEIKTGRSMQNMDFLKKFYQPPFYDESNDKRSIVRILPRKDKDEFYVETKLHRIAGKNYHCLRKNDERCPICEYRNALFAANDPATEDERYQLKAKTRFYMNVVARERVVINESTGKEEVVQDDGPLVYSCGVKVFEKVLRTMLKSDYGDVTDLVEGFDFRIEKEESNSGYPSYDNSEFLRNSSPAGTREQVEQWMENLHDLDSLISFKSYEELAEELEKYKSGLDTATTATSSISNLNFESDDDSDDSDNSEDSKGNDSKNDDSDDDFLKELERLKSQS